VAVWSELFDGDTLCAYRSCVVCSCNCIMQLYEVVIEKRAHVSSGVSQRPFSQCCRAQVGNVGNSDCQHPWWNCLKDLAAIVK
jgi:hypothetical protein